MYKQKIGHWGEKIIESYLLEHGYEVLARNARTPYGEIDLVVRKDAGIVFVEVKTRTNRNYGYPEQGVTVKKLEHLTQSAEAYMQEYYPDLDEWRIDVLALEGKPGEENLKIEWYENVTQA